MDDRLITHALALMLDDPTIGDWATDQTDRQLGRPCRRDDDADDPEWWARYTAIVNELLEAVRQKNQPDLTPA